MVNLPINLLKHFQQNDVYSYRYIDFHYFIVFPLAISFKALGTKLLKEIANGNTIKYQAEYQQKQDDSDDYFASSYPFDVDNVAEFANFCLECGGFKIC